MATEQQRRAQALLGTLVDERRALIAAALENPSAHQRGVLADLQDRIDAAARIAAGEAAPVEEPAQPTGSTATVLDFPRRTAP